MNDKLSWHETVGKFCEVSTSEKVHQCYFHQNPIEAAKDFENSKEFKLTLKLLKPDKIKTVLDIGAGNGIASYAFVNKGFQVWALEPDDSSLVGRKAIEKLNTVLENKITIVDTFAEELPFEIESFDLVYCRQVVHHAYDLKQFMSEISRVLKPDGQVLTIRDHVLSKKEDLQNFLNRHPLHRFYGGENAFTFQEYEHAFQSAGLTIEQKLLSLASPINYFPDTDKQTASKIRGLIKSHKNPFLYYFSRLFPPNWIINLWGKEASELLDDPGRLVSYRLVKNK